jgi:hypothetical protein
MPFRVIVEQALKACWDRQLQSIVATSGVENASYALTCIIDCITWILKIGVGGQVHVDIYGECVVRQVGLLLLKPLLHPKKKGNIRSNRRCFSLFKIN